MRDRFHRLLARLKARRVRPDWDERFAAVLPDDVEALLEGMHAGAPQEGADGALHDIDGTTRISRPRGMLLYHLCRELKPKVVLETGLAYGFSTVYLLAALRENGQGRHIAIDPLQSSTWRGVGAQRGRQLGIDDRFTVIEERSEHALPKLADQHLQVQLVFIDGDHRFDGAMLDFTLASRLCRIGALIVLDDVWMPAIRRLVNYIDKNRKDWRRLPSPIAYTCVFEKIGQDERKWNHFVRF